MKNKRVNFSLAFLICFAFATLKAQQVVPASGGNGTGAGGSTSYTVGQVIYTTNVGSNGSVGQGFQQAYEISVVTGTEKGSGILLQCSAYPNPTINNLTLKIEGEQVKAYSIKLFDLQGALVSEQNIEANETNITMKHLPSGTYFLKVYLMVNNGASQEIRIFKIIKKQ